nr:hypothetical protein [uncultured Campylobacter sp.]
MKGGIFAARVEFQLAICAATEFQRGKTDRREIEFYKISSATEPNKILNLKFYDLDKTLRLLR